MEHSIFCRVPEGHPIVARAIHRLVITQIGVAYEQRRISAAALAAEEGSQWQAQSAQPLEP